MGQPPRGEYVVASPLAVLRSEDQPSGVIRKNGEWDGEHHSAAVPSLHAPSCRVLCGSGLHIAVMVRGRLVKVME